eukprot:Gb_15246 [translate_table: standard]
MISGITGRIGTTFVGRQFFWMSRTIGSRWKGRAGLVSSPDDTSMSKLRMSLVGRALDCGPQVRVLHPELGSGPSPRYAQDLLFFFLPFPRFPMTVAPPSYWDWALALYPINEDHDSKKKLSFTLEGCSRRVQLMPVMCRRPKMPALGANIGDFLPFSRGSRAVPFKMQNLRRDPSPMDERSKSTTGWNRSEYPVDPDKGCLSLVGVVALVRSPCYARERSLLLYSQFNGRRERGSSLFGSLGLDPQKETFGIDRISGVMALDSIFRAIARDRVVWAVWSWIIQYALPSHFNMGPSEGFFLGSPLFLIDYQKPAFSAGPWRLTMKIPSDPSPLYVRERVGSTTKGWERDQFAGREPCILACIDRIEERPSYYVTRGRGPRIPQPGPDPELSTVDPDLILSGGREGWLRRAHLVKMVGKRDRLRICSYLWGIGPDPIASIDVSKGEHNLIGAAISPAMVNRVKTLAFVAEYFQMEHALSPGSASAHPVRPFSRWFGSGEMPGIAPFRCSSFTKSLLFALPVFYFKKEPSGYRSEVDCGWDGFSPWGATLLSSGLILIPYTMFVRWRDVIRESTLEGHHTEVVQLGLRYGSIPSIVSEVMFLFALLRASSHSPSAPAVEIGGIRPPKGIGAHHAIPAGKEQQAVYASVATVSLALVSTGFQGMEYYQAPLTIPDGTIHSIICGIRQYLGHLTKEHHVGSEAAAWYRHFVDVGGGTYLDKTDGARRMGKGGQFCKKPQKTTPVLIIKACAPVGRVKFLLTSVQYYTDQSLWQSLLLVIAMPASAPFPTTEDGKAAETHFVRPGAGLNDTALSLPRFQLALSEEKIKVELQALDSIKKSSLSPLLALDAPSIQFEISVRIFYQASSGWPSASYGNNRGSGFDRRFDSGECLFLLDPFRKMRSCPAMLRCPLIQYKEAQKTDRGINPEPSRALLGTWVCHGSKLLAKRASLNDICRWFRVSGLEASVRGDGTPCQQYNIGPITKRLKHRTIELEVTDPKDPDFPPDSGHFTLYYSTKFLQRRIDTTTSLGVKELQSFQEQ